MNIQNVTERVEKYVRPQLLLSIHRRRIKVGETIVLERDDRKEGSSIEDDSRMQISTGIFMRLTIPLLAVKLLSSVLTCRSRAEFEILKRPPCAPLCAIPRRRKLALMLEKRRREHLRGIAAEQKLVSVVAIRIQSWVNFASLSSTIEDDNVERACSDLPLENGRGKGRRRDEHAKLFCDARWSAIGRSLQLTREYLR